MTHRLIVLCLIKTLFSIVFKQLYNVVDQYVNCQIACQIYKSSSVVLVIECRAACFRTCTRVLSASLFKQYFRTLSLSPLQVGFDNICEVNAREFYLLLLYSTRTWNLFASSQVEVGFLQLSTGECEKVLSATLFKMHFEPFCSHFSSWFEYMQLLRGECKRVYLLLYSNSSYITCTLFPPNCCFNHIQGLNTRVKLSPFF